MKTLGFVKIIALCVVAAGLAGCSGGAKETPILEIQTGPNPVAQWRRSSLFEKPIVITDDTVWSAVQASLGKELQQVDFEKHTVVGAFAYEPDPPKLDPASGKPENRNYGVRLQSIRRSEDGALTVRMGRKSAPYMQQATGPLHYYFAVIDRHVGDTTFYVNGARTVVRGQAARQHEEQGMTDEERHARKLRESMEQREKKPDPYVKRNP